VSEHLDDSSHSITRHYANQFAARVARTAAILRVEKAENPRFYMGFSDLASMLLNFWFDCAKFEELDRWSRFLPGAELQGR